jgi:prophage DNA circulation protein
MSLRGVFNSVQGIDNTVKGLGDTLGRLVGGTYFSQLKPASFRKVPFVVLEGASQFGRRNALHEYPFRDEPWVEDLGKAARRFELKGFVVGDDVIAQRNTLISALERSGDGELVHPTLGKRNVALMDYVCREVWDRGRYFEFTFRFIEQGKRQFPKAAQRSTADVQESAARTNLKALAAFGLNVVTTLRMGIAGASEGLKQARAWAALATQAQRDATSLVNLATTLPGQFGRLLSRAGSVRTGEALVIGAFVTVETLKIQAAESRAAVAAAAAALDTAGQNLGPTTTDDFVTAAQALALAVRNGAPTPGDAVRALAAMEAF